jgi:hypothetical protein
MAQGWLFYWKGGRGECKLGVRFATHFVERREFPKDKWGLKRFVTIVELKENKEHGPLLRLLASCHRPSDRISHYWCPLRGQGLFGIRSARKRFQWCSYRRMWLRMALRGFPPYFWNEKKKKKKIPWHESTSELYRPTDGQRDGSLLPYSRFSRLDLQFFLSSSSSSIPTRLSGARSRPTTSQNIW